MSLAELAAVCVHWLVYEPLTFGHGIAIVSVIVLTVGIVLVDRR